MSLLRTGQTLLQRILAPSVRPPSGPVCITCGRIVDSEQLVDGEPGATTFARVLVRHHGAEELRTFDMGSVEWDSDDLKSHMMRANWFDPTGNEGLGRKVHPIDDGIPDYEQTKPTVLVPADVTGPKRNLGKLTLLDSNGNLLRRGDGGGGEPPAAA